MIGDDTDGAALSYSILEHSGVHYYSTHSAASPESDPFLIADYCRTTSPSS
jgi:hypothetical protein